jgi:uncharacterized membrane protein
MNPLKSVWGTIISGFVLAFVIAAVIDHEWAGAASLIIWLHVIVGVVWIGLLYYFNFVQVPAVADATANLPEGPAAINKFVAPRALAWFRYAALLTWLTGAAALEMTGGHGGFVTAFSLDPSQPAMQVIGVGAWLGTIMLFNVWVLIWPNQKKILGLGGATATDEQKAKAKTIALMASRTNTLLSIPMLMCMIAGARGHGLPF